MPILPQHFDQPCPNCESRLDVIGTVVDGEAADLTGFQCSNCGWYKFGPLRGDGRTGIDTDPHGWIKELGVDG